MTDADLARKRFFTLGLIRLSGVIAAFAGIAVAVKRPVEPADIIGGALIAFGIVQVILVPVLLLRAWRKPPLP